MWLLSWCWRRQHVVAIKNREASTIKQGLGHQTNDILRVPWGRRQNVVMILTDTSNVPLETQPKRVALTWKRCSHLHQWSLELFHFSICLPRAGAAWDRARSPGHQYQHRSRFWCYSRLSVLKRWEKRWRWRFQLPPPQNIQDGEGGKFDCCSQHQQQNQENGPTVHTALKPCLFRAS